MKTMKMSNINTMGLYLFLFLIAFQILCSQSLADSQTSLKWQNIIQLGTEIMEEFHPIQTDRFLYVFYKKKGYYVVPLTSLDKGKAWKFYKYPRREYPATTAVNDIVAYKNVMLIRFANRYYVVSVSENGELKGFWQRQFYELPHGAINLLSAYGRVYELGVKKSKVALGRTKRSA